MKKLISLLMVLGLVFSVAFSAIGAEKAEGLDVWFSMGDHSGDVGFQESITGSSIWELDFEMDGLYFIGFGTRYQFLQAEGWEKLSIAFEGYTARNMEGDVDDSQYTVASTAKQMYSTYDGEGETNQYDFNFGWELVDAASGSVKLDLLVGYYYQSYDIELDNQSTLISNYSSTNMVNIGHISEYETRFTATYFGLDGAFSLINDKLKISVGLKYLPRLRGDGEGKWQTDNIEFEHSGTGEGYIYEIGASFKPKQNWTIGLSIIQTDLEVNDGHSDYFVTGTTVDMYGNVIQGVPSYDATAAQTNLDYIEIDNLRTEIRVGYQFD